MVARMKKNPPQSSSLRKRVVHGAKSRTGPRISPTLGARSKFWGLSGSEDRGGGDNSIQFINSGRVGDKSFEEWRQKIGRIIKIGGRVGDNNILTFSSYCTG